MAEKKVQAPGQCPFDSCPYAERIKQIEEDLEGHATTIEHMENTLDSIVIPTQQRHTDAIDRHEEVTQKAAEFMAAAGGMWTLIQRVGIVLAAAASVATFVMKVISK